MINLKLNAFVLACIVSAVYFMYIFSWCTWFLPSRVDIVLPYMCVSLFVSFHQLEFDLNSLWATQNDCPFIESRRNFLFFGQFVKGQGDLDLECENRFRLLSLVFHLIYSIPNSKFKVRVPLTLLKGKTILIFKKSIP